MQIEQKQNCFLMLYAQLIVYNKYSWLFSENPTHFRRGLQEIVCVKFMEMLKQHLPLSNIGAVKFCGKSHLQAWQIKAERDNTQIIPASGNIK